MIFVMVAAVSSDGGCSVFFSWWLQCVHLFLTARILRESVLFIGTQFSILYTFMYSPA